MDVEINEAAKSSTRLCAPLVLVVDDCADNRELHALVLMSAGFRVEQANDGVDAVAQAQRLLPSVIVMDLSMPVMDGWEAIALIKAAPSMNATRVLVLSGERRATELERAMRAGADAVLGKPCRPHELVSLVSRLACDASSASEGNPESERAIAR
jgi:CheY-like chemotaxis protein